MEDKDIIKLFFLRDEAALEEADKKYGSLLHNMAMRILGQVQEAEEIHNDTLLRSWDTIPPEKPTRLGNYLAILCRNLALNRLDWNKAQKRGADITMLSDELEEAAKSQTVEDEINARELGRLISSFLRGQSPEDRQIFVRRYTWLMPTKSIAETMGLKESAVRVRLHRIRRKLKSYLEEQDVWILR